MSYRAVQIDAINLDHIVATRNDLPLDIRHASIERLNVIVVHAIDVALCAKHAHWNVRGPNFLSFHNLFEKVFKEMMEQIDQLGERATALGGIARGTVQAVAGSTSLAPYPILIAGESEHVEHLADRLGRLGSEIRAAVIATDSVGDVISADVLTQAGAAIDSLLWIIESHSVRPAPRT